MRLPTDIEKLIPRNVTKKIGILVERRPSIDKALKSHFHHLCDFKYHPENAIKTILHETGAYGNAELVSNPNPYKHIYKDSAREHVIYKVYTGVSERYNMKFQDMSDTTKGTMLVIVCNNDNCILFALSSVFHKKSLFPTHNTITCCSPENFVSRIYLEHDKIFNSGLGIAMIAEAGKLQGNTFQECLINKENGKIELECEKFDQVTMHHLEIVGAASLGQDKVIIGDKVKYIHRNGNEVIHLMEEQSLETYDVEDRRKTPMCEKKTLEHENSLPVHASKEDFIAKVGKFIDIGTCRKYFKLKKPLENCLKIPKAYIDRRKKTYECFDSITLETKETEAFSIDELLLILRGSSFMFFSIERQVTFIFNPKHCQESRMHENHCARYLKEYDAFISPLDFWVSIMVFVLLVMTIPVSAFFLIFFKNEGLFSGIFTAATLFAALYIAYENCGNRMCIFPLRERIFGRVSIKTWDSLLALYNNDLNLLKTEIMKKKGHVIPIGYEGTSFVKATKTRSFSSPGIMYQDLLMCGLVLYHGRDRKIRLLNASDHDISDLITHVPLKAYARNWRQATEAQIGLIPDWDDVTLC